MTELALDMQRIEALCLLQVHRGSFFEFQCYCHVSQSFNPIHHMISMDRQMDRQRDKQNRLLNPTARMCMWGNKECYDL